MDNSSIVLDDFQYSIVYGRSMYDSGLFFFSFFFLLFVTKTCICMI